MPFEPRAPELSWCERRPAREVDGSALLERLSERTAQSICELGTGQGQRARWLLQRFPAAEFRGFEPSPDLLRASRSALAGFANRASVEPVNPALPLPLPASSQDLFLAVDLLEFLRMDQLYMVLAEARRTLRPGGQCALRCLSFGNGTRARLGAWAQTLAYRNRPALVGGARPLDLNHYISPEDWRVLTDERTPEGWLSRQTVIMERIADV